MFAAKVRIGISLCFWFMYKHPPISFHVHMIPRRRKDPIVYIFSFVRQSFQNYTQSGPSLKIQDLRPMPKTIVARIDPDVNIIFVRSWREIYHLTVAVVEYDNWVPS